MAKTRPLSHEERWNRLAETLSGGLKPIRLDEGALLISADLNPELVIQDSLDDLDALADELRPRIAQASTPLERLQTLASFLFVERQYEGNRDGYYDANNSFLDQVIDFRQGIPITLSVLAMEVGRRVGLRLAGVAFPAHFLVKNLEMPDLYLDAFNGTLMTQRDCEALLAELTEGEVTFDPRFLQPTPPRQILLRMLRNLKAIFVGEDEFGLAVQVVDRMLLLAPEATGELRDRGLLRLRTQKYATGLADLERYLKLNPADPDHETLLATMAATRTRLWSLN